METILLVFMLSVESSYLQDIERPTKSSPDTLQFILHQGSAWRIKTFAIDHDVHVWGLGQMSPAAFEKLAHANSGKHYGDVIAKTIVLRTARGLDGLDDDLKTRGLAGGFEVPKSRDFAFWVPELAVYKTKSTPK